MNRQMKTKRKKYPTLREDSERQKAPAPTSKMVTRPMTMPPSLLKYDRGPLPYFSRNFLRLWIVFWFAILTVVLPAVLLLLSADMEMEMKVRGVERWELRGIRGRKSGRRKGEG